MRSPLTGMEITGDAGELGIQRTTTILLERKKKGRERTKVEERDRGITDIWPLFSLSTARN
jgi:hypothetical protein